MRIVLVPKDMVLSKVEADVEDDELTVVEAVGMDSSVWVGKTSDIESDGDGNPDEYQIIGDVSGFCYYAGSESDCDSIADAMNVQMPFTADAAEVESAMDSYHPRLKRAKRSGRVTPAEKLDRLRYRRKNKRKLAMQRKQYYRKNKSQLQRRANIRKRRTRPVVEKDSNYHYTYK